MVLVGVRSELASLVPSHCAKRAPSCSRVVWNEHAKLHKVVN